MPIFLIEGVSYLCSVPLHLTYTSETISRDNACLHVHITAPGSALQTISREHAYRSVTDLRTRPTPRKSPDFMAIFPQTAPHASSPAQSCLACSAGTTQAAAWHNAQTTSTATKQAIAPASLSVPSSTASPGSRNSPNASAWSSVRTALGAITTIPQGRTARLLEQTADRANLLTAPLISASIYAHSP